MPQSVYLTVAELAKILRIRPEKVRVLAAKDMLPCLKDRNRRMLFCLDHVMEFLRPDVPIGGRSSKWQAPKGARPVDLGRLEALLEGAPEGAEDEPDLENEAKATADSGTPNGSPRPAGKARRQRAAAR